MEKVLTSKLSLTAVADAIRSKGGTEESLVFPNGFVEAIEGLQSDGGYDKGYADGYGEGQKAEYDKFWDNYQQNGNRTGYGSAFFGSGWNNENYNPKYVVKPIGAATSCFQSSNINKRIEVDTSQATELTGFIRQSLITEVGTVDARNIKDGSNLHTAFAMCPYLRKIDKVIASDTNRPNWSNTFTSDPMLEEIRFEGKIFTSIGFSQSPLLTNESVQSIIDALADLTEETTQTLSLHADVKATLTEEQLASITQKNWTVA